MSEALRQMLAERAAREAEADARERTAVHAANKRWDMYGAPIIEQIELAAPFIDRDCPPTKWKPSSILKIWLCCARDNEEAEASAATSVIEMLDLARQRFRAGLHPNPFLGEIAS